jgi:hypothetical protein
MKYKGAIMSPGDFRKHAMLVFAVGLVSVLSIPSAKAQGHSSGRGSIGISGNRIQGRRFGDGRRRGRFGRDSIVFGAPYFYSGYYDSYGFDYPVPPPTTRPVPVPQVAPAPQIQVKNEPLADSALLELRGNTWVRVTDFSESSGPVSTPAHSSAVSKETPPVQSLAVSKEMPPAVLVYRDGHTEDVSSYSIIGPIIYTDADYWTDGKWTRMIQIADLNIPATLKQNQQRGVKFDLPSGPNEVVIRP